MKEDKIYQRPICSQCGKNNNYKKYKANIRYLTFAGLNYAIPYPESETFVCNCGYTFTVPVDSGKCINDALDEVTW